MEKARTRAQHFAYNIISPTAFLPVWLCVWGPENWNCARMRYSNLVYQFAKVFILPTSGIYEYGCLET